MMTPYLMRFGLFVLTAGLVSPGQAEVQPRYPTNHQSWSTEAGLPQNSVHQILQSHDGFLWLATEGGAVRCDGASFKVFNHDTDPSFTSSDVTSLAEDRRGNMWFGTADGIIEYTSRHTIHFGPSDGLPAATVASVAPTDDGSVLVLAAGGLAKFDGSRFQAVQPEPAYVDHLQPEPDGPVVLFSQTNLSLYTRMSTSPYQMPASLDGSELRGFLGRQNGAVWLWTDREVQFRFPKRQITWHIGSDLPGTRIQSFAVDRSGRAWIGTNRGLVTATPGQHPETVRELGQNSILSILEDAEGNLWIGTDTSGLHALRRRAFREQPALTDEEISCVAQSSDGSIWIGTRQDGLRRIRSESLTDKVDRPVANNALTSPVILSLAPGFSGDMWVGTPDGLTHISSKGIVTRYTSSDGLPDDLVRSLLVSRDGTVWIGTRHGLARFQSGRFNVFTKPNGLGGDLIGPLYQAVDGDLWVATVSGVSRLSGAAFQTFGFGSGQGPVTGITEDSTGRIWVSTKGSGVLLWDGAKFNAIDAMGVPREVYGLVADSHGSLWLRVRRGIIRTSIQDLENCGSGRNCQTLLTTYAAADGLPSEEVVEDTRPSIWRTSRGKLWFTTRKGIAIVDPENLPVNEIPPPVIIESFSSDNKEVSFTGVPELPSAPARYTFDYAGLSYTIPSKVLYRTKLEGFDSDWSIPTARRYASYTSLAPGRYTFRVQAANNDGVWNLTGAQLDFRIMPPFYRRWWFLLALALAAACLAVLLYRLRIRRLHMRFEAVLAERNRIAREIHDTLAQDLVGVAMQLNLVSQLLGSKKVSEATQQLTTTRRLVTEGLEEARRSIWNLRTESSDGTLPTKLTALANRYSTDGLAIKTRIGGTYRELPHVIEDEILRIVQEAITNIRRHASASEANVDCQYQSDKLVVAIKDDGRGFSLSRDAARNGHFGLEGMRERAASLGGELNLSSKPGSGTLVELKIPITDIKGSDA